MQTVETIIDSLLEARLGEYMTVEEQIQAQEEAEQEEKESEWDLPAGEAKRGIPVRQMGGDDYDFEDNDERLFRLQSQIAVLQEVKELLKKQHAETKANFLAVEKRDEHSSKQNLWLTITTSAISIIIGWLLSLLGSPLTLVHTFGR